MTEEGKHLVLAVDDEPDILTLNRFILEQAGFQVVTAGDGVDAIQKAVDFKPDVIVLDVMMPRMNGYQVCRLLKSDPRTENIPIIICTVKSLESEKLYAYTSGADEYLVKPFDKDRLVELVSKSLRGKGRRAETRQGGEIARSRTSTDSILSDVNRLLDRRLMELTILQDMTRALGGTLDLEGILRQVRRSLEDLGFLAARILLLEEDGILAERAAAAEGVSVSIKAYPLFSNMLYGKEAVLLDAEVMSRSAPLEVQHALHSHRSVVVPVRAKGKPIGLLIVESPPGQSVDRGQKDFLLTLASQAGLAIENANLYEKTLQLSITDGLTEIFNYRYFRQRLENEIARAKRYGYAIGLLILDIDHFKSFNDRYGHLLGDTVLKNVAAILRSKTRDIDAVARYGGEEFGVLLNEIKQEEAALYAERIREAVEEFHIAAPDGTAIGVTVSLGVAVCHKGELDEQEFIRRADQALYRAKDLGRNRVCIWREEGDHLCPADEKRKK